MKQVKVSRQTLLKTVLDNLEIHKTEYSEAVEGYKVLVLETAQKNLKLAKSGNLEEFEKMTWKPTAPKTYEKDYTRVIEMLRMSIDEEIILDEEEFSQYVMDEWKWKQSFTMSNSLYKSS